MINGHNVDLLARLAFEAEYMREQLSPGTWKEAGDWDWGGLGGPKKQFARQKIAEVSCEAMQASLEALSK